MLLIKKKSDNFFNFFTAVAIIYLHLQLRSLWKVNMVSAVKEKDNQELTGMSLVQQMFITYTFCDIA